MDGELDVPVASMLEQKFEKSRFTRVDSDIIDRIIVKEDAKATDLTDEQRDNLSEVFRSQMPKLDKAEFMVEVQALGLEAQPVVVTQNEYIDRKSTRLNSSHANISYAVFCLKKKRNLQ